MVVTLASTHTWAQCHVCGATHGRNDMGCGYGTLHEPGCLELEGSNIVGTHMDQRSNTNHWLRRGPSTKAMLQAQVPRGDLGHLSFLETPAMVWIMHMGFPRHTSGLDAHGFNNKHGLTPSMTHVGLFWLDLGLEIFKNTGVRILCDSLFSSQWSMAGQNKDNKPPIRQVLQLVE